MNRMRFVLEPFRDFSVSFSNRVGGPRRAWAIGGCGILLILASTCCCCSLILVPFSLIFVPFSNQKATSTLTNTATNAPPTANVKPIELPKATATLPRPSRTPLPPTSTNPALTNTTTATKPAPTDTQTPTLTRIPASPSTTDTQLPSPTAESAITILVLTSPIQAGEKATVQVQTTPGTSCSLTFTTPSGTHSSAKGLGETIADNNGVCSWTWKISASIKAGTGKLTITVGDVTQPYDIVIQ